MIKIKKAAWQGGWRRNQLYNHKYNNHVQLSTQNHKFFSRLKKIGNRPANRHSEIAGKQGIS